MAYRGRLGLAMRRTSPRRFAPLATLCVATVVSLVLASVPKLGDTEQSFSGAPIAMVASRLYDQSLAEGRF